MMALEQRFLKFESKLRLFEPVTAQGIKVVVSANFVACPWESVYCSCSQPDREAGGWGIGRDGRHIRVDKVKPMRKLTRCVLGTVSLCAALVAFSPLAYGDAGKQGPGAVQAQQENPATPRPDDLISTKANTGIVCVWLKVATHAGPPVYFTYIAFLCDDGPLIVYDTMTDFGGSSGVCPSGTGCESLFLRGARTLSDSEMPCQKSLKKTGRTEKDAQRPILHFDSTTGLGAKKVAELNASFSIKGQAGEKVARITLVKVTFENPKTSAVETRYFGLGEEIIGEKADSKIATEATLEESDDRVCYLDLGIPCRIFLYNP